MSLIHPVTELEGVDRDIQHIEDGKTLRRVLSYDVFPPEEPEALKQPRKAAYKVSERRRIFQVVVAVVSCWLASGIVFGFAALKKVFLAEGVYSELCADFQFRDREDPCVEQDIRLNLFFTVGSITCNVSALIVGAILDRYGRRVGYIAGSIILATGTLLMSFAFAISEFDGYLLANICLALGGTLIFVPSFQIANSFPKHSGIIVALITGAFDASSAVFLFFRIAYKSSSGHFRPEVFFAAYLIVPVLILVAEFAVMPSHDYHTGPELKQKLEKAQDPTYDVHDSDEEIDSDSELRRIRAVRARQRKGKLEQLDALVGDKEERQEREEQEKEVHEASKVWGALHGEPAHAQMLTPWFIFILLLTVLQMLRMNYFIATIDSQYGFMLGDDRSRRITGFFDVALPVGGLVSTPLVALLLSRLSVPAVLGVLTWLITLTGATNLMPYAWSGYATVVLFVFMRPLYYSAMSDYAVKVFGFRTFGKIYGTIICLSGLVNFAQSALDALTLEVLNGNPTVVNSVMTGAGAVLGIVLTAFTHFKGRDVREQQREEEAEVERMSLLPVEEDESEAEFGEY